MTMNKASKTTCDTAMFTEIPTDLIARLTREANRRVQDAPVARPLAHRVILARREDELQLRTSARAVR
ncbi:hypothetical protein BC777_0023 [Yoonia maricola]|uniref:Uncharacterized protein n=1 Tax=Yoonia maricola TaxID=420999 RepID=A0A2M8WJU9_9RHOB|nr:hypothetical protein [Yoonia maricola]PJI91199.1 hypothetical protein BC777_0023 [Yoonia maricola]